MDQFQLLEIRIGNEILHARPIAWSSEDPYEDGTKVTEYETTCPSCSQMLHFKVEQIKDVDGDKLVDCELCGAKTDKNEEVERDDEVDSSTIINHDGPDISSKDIKKIRPQRSEPAIKPAIKSAQDQDDECPFQDPVEAGELKLA